MSQSCEFYRERAREAAAQAREADLDNVRKRALRAERTWRALASRARKVEADRARAEQEAAARRAEAKAREAEPA